MTEPARLPSAADVLETARATRGFMPDDEGRALAAVAAGVSRLSGPEAGVIVEVGAYCGKSTLYLAHGALEAARKLDELTVSPRGRGSSPTVIFSVDHHRGSEENQAGWEHHDATLVNEKTGRLDTLPIWRESMELAGVESFVVGVVGDSATVAARWNTPAGLVFIDGGHGSEPAWADYNGWAPAVALLGWLAIHDVFPDPVEGGRPPFELYCRAIESGAFEEDTGLGCGSLRILRRVSEGH